LFKIGFEEEFVFWLTVMLERILDALQAATRRSGNIQIAGALDLMRAHYADPLTRDEVARLVGMSPSHFSRSFKRHVKRGFADVLNQIRVDRACDLLNRTDRSLALVALDTGFTDQSYFHKVFRRYTGMTPRAFRARRRTE
jgi:transcriptional regulator GlxA family with amidase domain